MSFESAHAYARSSAEARAEADAELDDLAPGRLTRSEPLKSPRHAALSGLIQRKPSGAANDRHDADLLAQVIGRAAASAGMPLPAGLLRKFELALGADLSGVRLHLGGASHAAAHAIGAVAYTLGQDIHFAAGYDPTSAANEALVAHEVAHTVQQRGGTPVTDHALEVSAPGDGFEHEADRAADAMVAGAAFALGSAPVVAARKADPATSGPGEIKTLHTVGYPIAEPTPVYSAPDPKASVLVNLPKGGWIQIVGSNGSYYVVSYDGTKQGYIDQRDLDVDGTPSAVDHDPAQDPAKQPDAAPQAPAAPAATPGDGKAPDAKQTAGERYRSAITKALDFWKGAVEGGADGKFAQFRSSDKLEAARKNAGKDHKTFTTCIEFLSQIQTDAARDAHAKQSVAIDSGPAEAKGRKKLPKDAWHAASANMAARPKPGDIIFLVFAKDVKNPDGSLKFGQGWFSHVGFFTGIASVDKTAADDPVELWHTVDGGQGTSTKYDDKGVMIGTHGKEELKESPRYYHPAKNLITGEKIQGDTDARTLLGWVDIEKIVASDSPPDP